ncbi:hypothetical protein HD806DRAFT_539344 [Xylariaceae sp. AK1471]|nr:hypothetical protein HD806DRAFT_539344 [Xylariaceae sp. AK1471]
MLFVIQTVLGLAMSAGFVAFGTLIADLNPKRSSTAAASTNIVRCSLAAARTAAFQPIMDFVGADWCFVIFGLVTSVCGPISLLQVTVGSKWREAEKEGSSGLGPE